MAQVSCSHDKCFEQRNPFARQRNMSQTPTSGPSAQCFPHQSQNRTLDCPTPTESLLQEVFALLGKTWTCDFLFKMDAAADVSVLTNPSQLQYALVFDGAAQLFQATGEYHAMFNMEFDYRWIIVPVISIGGLNAFIVVPSHETFRAENACHEHNATAVVRMIQNSLTADVLVCVDEPAHNLVWLILFSSKSRGMRRHVVLRFKRDACLAALSGQWGPNFNDISRALALSKECDEVYHCPYCHSGVSGAHCKCIYEVKRPAHPLDFSSMTLNLLSYSGNWSGLCNLNLFSNGVRYAAARLSSSASATCSFEPSIIRCDVEASIRSKMGTSSRVTSLLSSPWVAQTAPEDQNMVWPVHIADGTQMINTTGSDEGGTERVALETAQRTSYIAPGHVQIQQDVSMARSNLVQRQRLESFHQDLRSMSRKKLELQQRQKELNAENAHLRRLLATTRAS